MEVACLWIRYPRVCLGGCISGGGIVSEEGAV